MLIAGRVRRPDEGILIQEALEKHIKRKVNPEQLFASSQSILQRLMVSEPPQGFGHVVWTFGMRRLAVLVGQAVRFKEPILLVGETGWVTYSHLCTHDLYLLSYHFICGLFNIICSSWLPKIIAHTWTGMFKYGPVQVCVTIIAHNCIIWLIISHQNGDRNKNLKKSSHMSCYNAKNHCFLD